MGGDLGGAFPLGVEIAHGCQPIMKWRREKPSEERGLRLRRRRQLAAPPEIVRMFDREAVRGRRGPELDRDDVLDRAVEPARIFMRLEQYRHALVIGHRSEEHTSELQSLMRLSYAVLCLKQQTLPDTRYNSTLLHI